MKLYSPISEKLTLSPLGEKPNIKNILSPPREKLTFSPNGEKLTCSPHGENLHIKNTLSPPSEKLTFSPPSELGKIVKNTHFAYCKFGRNKADKVVRRCLAKRLKAVV